MVYVNEFLIIILYSYGLYKVCQDNNEQNVTRIINKTTYMSIMPTFTTLGPQHTHKTTTSHQDLGLDGLPHSSIIIIIIAIAEIHYSTATDHQVNVCH